MFEHSRKCLTSKGSRRTDPAQTYGDSDQSQRHPNEGVIGLQVPGWFHIIYHHWPIETRNGHSWKAVGFAAIGARIQVENQLIH